MEKIIKFFLIAYFVIFPFGQLARIPSGIFNLPPEVNFYLTDLVLALLLSTWLVWRLILGRKSYKAPPLAKPVALFALLATFSLTVNAGRLTDGEVFVAGLYLIRWVVYAGLYFVISDLKWRGRCFLIWAGVATAGLGLIQYFFWPDIRPLQIYGWDIHYYRLVGTLLDPGFTGLVLGLTLILLVGHVRPKKMPFYVLFSFMYMALALTYSRSSYLAYLMGMSTLAFLKRSSRLFLVVIVVGILTLAVLPQNSGDFSGEGVNLQRQSTVNARLMNWQQTLQIIADHSLVGVGFNAYRYIQRDYGFLGTGWRITHAGAGADASLLFVWATTGILGLTAYLWLWLKAVNVKSLILISSITALFVHAFFLNSLFYPWVMGWMWTLLATERS